MSNEKNNIDELFKSKLSDYSLEAPEHVWKNIEAKRTPLYRAVNYFKNKRSVVTGALLLIGVAATAFIINTGLQPTLAENHNPAPVTGQTTVAPVTLPANDSPVAQNTTGQTGTQTPATITVASQNTVGSNHHTIATQTANTTTTGNRNNADNTPANNTTTNTTTGNPATDIATTDITTTPNTSQQSDNTSTQTTQAAQLPAQDKNDAAAQGNEETTAPATALADVTENPAETTTEGEGTDAVQNTQNQAVKPPKNKARNFFVDAYTSLDFTQRALSASGAGANYIDAKKQAEKFTPGYSAGIRVSYKFEKGFKLRAGIQYSQLNEKLNFNSKTSYTRTDTVIGYITDPNSGITKPHDTTINTINGTNTVSASAKNTYTFIDVPVQIELPLYKTEKLSLFATGGAAINLRFAQRGMQLNRDLSGASDVRTNNMYKTTAGISLLGGFGMEYKCNPVSPWSFLIEGTYRHGTGNVFGSNAGMIQRYRTLSGSVGIRYNF